jgi:hypothetical protein
MRSVVQLYPGPPLYRGAVAQLGERLVCNQEATGSIPVSSTKEFMSPPWLRILVLIFGSGVFIKGIRGGEFKRRSARELKMSQRSARLMCLGTGAFLIWVAVFRL